MKKISFIIGLFSIIFFIAGCSHNIKEAETVASSVTAPTNTPEAVKTQETPTTNTTTIKAPAAPAKTSPATNISTPSSATEPQKPSLRVISLDAGNLYFKPKKLTLTLGQPVKINYTNKGEHTFTVDEIGVNKALKTDASGSFTFTPEKKGKFELYCATPGHREAGMVGTIEIVE